MTPLLSISYYCYIIISGTLEYIILLMHITLEYLPTCVCKFLSYKNDEYMNKKKKNNFIEISKTLAKSENNIVRPSK